MGIAYGGDTCRWSRRTLLACPRCICKDGLTCTYTCNTDVEDELRNFISFPLSYMACITIYLVYFSNNEIDLRTKKIVKKLRYSCRNLLIVMNNKS